MTRDTYTLKPDVHGVLWDLLLYVPTVIFLGFYGLTLWFNAQGGSPWAYLLWFMSSFFLIAGANRILKRLLMLPGTPVGLTVDKRSVTLMLKEREDVNLVQGVRFFSDYAGKSFGLTGKDASGKVWQFVMHRGQFMDQSSFDRVHKVLEIYKA